MLYLDIFVSKMRLKVFYYFYTFIRQKDFFKILKYNKTTYENLFIVKMLIICNISNIFFYINLYYI